MKPVIPSINPNQETKKITSFIQSVLEKQRMQNVVIALSGGIDSATCLSLLTKSIPSKNIYILHLPYFAFSEKSILPFVTSLQIPKKNFQIISIKKTVNAYKTALSLQGKSKLEWLRIGNIAARSRMIFAYDLAKQKKALVCGTENKSEYFLSYFTRFGDEASDFEPIRHLYKTQVYKLAEFLKVPKEILQKAPSAGLWKNQTDEKEFGFSYQEADEVTYLYFEKKLSLQQIEKKYKNASKVITRIKNNEYKHKTPYLLGIRN